MRKSVIYELSVVFDKLRNELLKTKVLLIKDHN